MTDGIKCSICVDSAQKQKPQERKRKRYRADHPKACRLLTSRARIACRGNPTKAKTAGKKKETKPSWPPKGLWITDQPCTHCLSGQPDKSKNRRKEKGNETELTTQKACRLLTSRARIACRGIPTMQKTVGNYPRPMQEEKRKGKMKY